MKKFILLLTFMNLVLLKFGYCQMENQKVPESIQYLGEKYINIYQNISKSIYGQKDVLLSNTKAFPATSNLYSKVANDFGLSLNTETYNSLDNMDYLFINGIASLDNIKTNNIDKNLFLLLKNCYAGIKNLNSENELTDYFMNYSKKIKASGLSNENIDFASIYLSSLVASTDATTMVLRENAVNGKFSLWGAIKCAAGTVGGAVLGGLAGAAVGTVTLPIIGTVSGTAVGFYGGALAGMAASCD